MSVIDHSLRAAGLLSSLPIENGHPYGLASINGQTGAYS